MASRRRPRPRGGLASASGEFFHLGAGYLPTGRFHPLSARPGDRWAAASARGGARGDDVHRGALDHLHSRQAHGARPAVARFMEPGHRAVRSPSSAPGTSGKGGDEASGDRARADEGPLGLELQRLAAPGGCVRVRARARGRPLERWASMNRGRRRCCGRCACSSSASRLPFSSRSSRSCFPCSRCCAAEGSRIGFRPRRALRPSAALGLRSHLVRPARPGKLSGVDFPARSPARRRSFKTLSYPPSGRPGVARLSAGGHPSGEVNKKDIAQVLQLCVPASIATARAAHVRGDHRGRHRHRLRLGRSIASPAMAADNAGEPHRHRPRCRRKADRSIVTLVHLGGCSQQSVQVAPDGVDRRRRVPGRRGDLLRDLGAANIATSGGFNRHATVSGLKEDDRVLDRRAARPRATGRRPTPSRRVPSRATSTSCSSATFA